MSKKTKKPHLTVNVAMSADGKISSYRREKFALGSAEDRHLMDLLRARSDAVIVGSRTVRLDGWAIRVRDEATSKKREQRRGEPHPLNVVLSTRLDLSPNCEFFDHPQTKKLIVTTGLAPTNRIRRFERHGDVWVVTSKQIPPARVLEELGRRGCKNILLEGGGELNFSFFKAGLIDELYITVTPRLLGGQMAPTPVDGRGFLKIDQVDLELASSRRKGNEVFLRYKIK